MKYMLFCNTSEYMLFVNHYTKSLCRLVYIVFRSMDTIIPDPKHFGKDPDPEFELRALRIQFWVLQNKGL
jgi:hypothetical protein